MAKKRMARQSSSHRLKRNTYLVSIPLTRNNTPDRALQGASKSKVFDTFSMDLVRKATRKLTKVLPLSNDINKVALPFGFGGNRPAIVIDKAKVCKARKVRRQVLFAKGKQGGNHKPPTRNLTSYVRC